MGCHGSKIEPEDNSAPPIDVTKPHKCTDVFCLLLYIVFWACMIIIAIVGLKNGNPDSLIYGTDYNGDVCGSGSMSATKYVYYPKITEDLLQFAKAGVSDLDIPLFGVCLSECPQPETSPVVCKYNVETDYMSKLTTAKEKWELYDSCQSILETSTKCQAIRSGCWAVPMETENYLFRCIWKRIATINETTVCKTPNICKDVNSTSCLDVQSTDLCMYEKDGRKYLQNYQGDPDTIPAPMPVLYLPSAKYVRKNFTDECITKITITEEAIEGAAQDNILLDQLYDAGAVIMRWFGDVEKSWEVIVIAGGLGALALGFVYLIILKYFVGLMVWLILWSVMIASIALTLFLYSKAGLVSQDDLNSVADSVNVGTKELPDSFVEESESNKRKYFEYGAYALTVVTFILLILILWMRKRVKLAVAIMKEASKALQKMPMVILIPFLSTIAIATLLIYWVIIAAYLASSGDSIALPSSLTDQLCNNSTDTDCFTAGSSWKGSDLSRNMLLFHFFGLLWSMQFIDAVGLCVIAGSVSVWYFTREVDGNRDLGKFPVCAAFGRTIKHFGSLAFGSLIIAIIKFIRAILYYLDKKSAKLKQRSALVKLVFKCLQCCLWCFEKVLKFINKNAYIIIAMKGNVSFCPAAKRAFTLLMQNILRVGALNLISAFIMWLGKLLIVALCGFGCYSWLNHDEQFSKTGENTVESPVLPVVLTMILAYAVGSAFMSVYDMAIDTIFLCFCEDEAHAEKKSEYVQFAPGSLKSVMKNLRKAEDMKKHYKKAIKDSHKGENTDVESIEVKSAPEEATAATTPSTGHENRLM